jgi:hypothetical protein
MMVLEIDNGQKSSKQAQGMNRGRALKRCTFMNTCQRDWSAHPLKFYTESDMSNPSQVKANAD